MTKEAPHCPPPVPCLKSVDVAGIADYLKSGKVKNVIVMQGAGVSTAAGIPDFRTPVTGLYAQLEKYNLPDTTAVFDIEYFDENPAVFYDVCKSIAPGGFTPTIVHYFSVFLEQKGILKRVFTQNIDGLERLAGVPPEKLVEAHGHFFSGHCRKCKKEYTSEQMKGNMTAGTVMNCNKCDGVVKPDVVFFGENLPERFNELSSLDFPECDLLIVIGTSLQVQPFCLLTSRVEDEVPRILFNMAAAGHCKECAAVVDGAYVDLNKGKDGGLFKFGHKTNRRDVLVSGDCQEGIMDFIKLVGWEDEFMAILPESLKRALDPASEPEV